MHDLDRQQLEQSERDGLAGLLELEQPESYAYEYGETGYEAPPAGSHGARPRSGRWIRRGANIVLLGA
ncbi:MAG TPA: hypothetical protein VFY45_11260 [Baekduia sp.]|nr:hypothetical protein [Baekduia sp.]